MEEFAKLVELVEERNGRLSIGRAAHGKAEWFLSVDFYGRKLQRYGVDLWSISKCALEHSRELLEKLDAKKAAGHLKTGL